jgi:hypothetical protein
MITGPQPGVAPDGPSLVDSPAQARAEPSSRRVTSPGAAPTDPSPGAGSPSPSPGAAPSGPSLGAGSSSPSPGAITPSFAGRQEAFSPGASTKASQEVLEMSDRG